MRTRLGSDSVGGAPLLGAIADDVTGATDLCSTLAREGMRTVQTMGVARDVDIGEPDAVVVALKSRTAPVSDAVGASLDAFAWLRELGARQFFLKICSTFDSTPAGNIGPVADALLGALDAPAAVVCPAYPANGRTLYHGHLFVGDRLLSESALARHPLTPMTDPDVVRLLARQTTRRVTSIPYGVVREGARAIEARLAELRRNGTAYAVTDALTDDDLRAIGTACAELPLVVGGSGVALGLPDNFRLRGFRLHGALPATAETAAPVPPGGATAVLAGSCSEATRAQVARMAERFPSHKLELGTDVESLAVAAVAELEQSPVLVYTTAPPEEVAAVQAQVGAAAASAQLEGGLSDVACTLLAAGMERLVVAGGETSATVLDALGVRALSVGRELAPGVPWMTSLGGPPLALALKSGNFGGVDFFLEAVEGSP